MGWKFSFSKGKKLSAVKIRRAGLRTPPEGRDSSEAGKRPARAAQSRKTSPKRHRVDPGNAGKDGAAGENSSKRLKWVFIQNPRYIITKITWRFFSLKAYLMFISVYLKIIVNTFRDLCQALSFCLHPLPKTCLLLLLLLLSRFSRVRLCATPLMAAHQALPSLGFSRQEHWSGLPFPSPV